MTTISSDVDSPSTVPADAPVRGQIGFASLGSAPSPWRGGLVAARRHTVFVRILRGLAVVVCVAAAGIVLSGALRGPARQGLGGLSAEKVALDGTKVTLEEPKISGFQLDRRPYSIKARRGVQDLASPHIIELLDIDAGIGTADEKTMQVVASQARYDSQNELIFLTGDVKITSTSGYDLSLHSARVDVKTGTMVSDSSVRLRLDGATVSAERMTFDDRRHVITFDGGVKSLIQPHPQRDAHLDVPSVRTVQ